MAKDKSGEKRKADAPAALERSPIQLFHRALQVALDVYAEEAGQSGVTQRQYAVLAAVETSEGLTQTDLVRITGIDRSTLADMAARMIKKGLLERERSASDARANAVRLTDAGRAALDEARPVMAAADERLLRMLSSSKREGLVNLLRDLVKAGERGAVVDLPKKAKAEKPTKPPKAEKIGKKKKKPKKVALVAA